MNLKIRLALLSFLEFAVWGAYLTSMGSYVAEIGHGDMIWLFYASQGFVSIFMPALIGIIADKWIPAQKLLSICHAICGLFMLSAGYYAMTSGTQMQFGIFYCLYLVSVAFFMPTIALSYSVAYNVLERNGMDPVKDFPPVRVWGTVGFIVSMLAVNFATNASGVQFQHSYEQFLVSGAVSIVLCGFALTMPNCPCQPKNAKVQTFAEASGLSAFKLFKQRHFALFFIFAMLLGVSLQITNGYANDFISSFRNSTDTAIANSWGAHNANALISLSQISETLCILLIPFFMKRFGIKTVMLIAMLAWVIRFGFFGLGNPAGGVWLFILSCIVYGVAFDFFNISCSLYVNEHADKDIRSSAQGLFFLMTNGLGASIGTWGAGIVVNHFVYNTQTPDWSTAWYIFAAYALVVAVLFALVFRVKKPLHSPSDGGNKKSPLEEI